MLLCTSTIIPPISVQGFRGDLDIFGALDLRRSLSRAADAGCNQLRLDLSGVTFADPAAIGHLSRTWQNLTLSGLSLVITAASSAFDRACRTTGRRFE